MYFYSFLFFFFNDTATTEIYTFPTRRSSDLGRCAMAHKLFVGGLPFSTSRTRSEEHTSELQSLRHLVCRLLLEKKKKNMNHKYKKDMNKHKPYGQTTQIL